MLDPKVVEIFLHSPINYLTLYLLRPSRTELHLKERTEFFFAFLIKMHPAKHSKCLNSSSAFELFVR